MMIRTHGLLSRLLILAYALAAVLGVDLVLCVDPGGHTAIELGISACCDGPEASSSEGPAALKQALADAADEPHAGVEDCGPCTDYDLIDALGVKVSPSGLQVPPLLPAASSWGRAVSNQPLELDAGAARWSTRPPRVARRGTVLRC